MGGEREPAVRVFILELMYYCTDGTGGGLLVTGWMCVGPVGGLDDLLLMMTPPSMCHWFQMC